MSKKEFLEAARTHLELIQKVQSGQKWGDWVYADPKFAAIMTRQLEEQIAYLKGRLEK